MTNFEHDDEPTLDMLSALDPGNPSKRPAPAPKKPTAQAAIIKDTSMTIVVTRRGVIAFIAFVLVAFGLFAYVLYDVVRTRDTRRPFVDSVLYNFICFVQVQNPNDPNVIQARKMVCDGKAGVPTFPGQTPAPSSTPTPTSTKTDDGAAPMLPRRVVGPTAHNAARTTQTFATRTVAVGRRSVPAMRSESRSAAPTTPTAAASTSTSDVPAILGVPGCHLDLIGIRVCAPPSR